NGYVGTVVAASFASIGHTVVGLEADPAKLGALRSGRAPFHEPVLGELLECGLGRGNLAFTDDPEQAMGSSRFVFLCVGSPPRPDGSVDLRPLASAGLAVARWLRPDHVLAINSTLPVGPNPRLRSPARHAAALAIPHAPCMR